MKKVAASWSIPPRGVPVREPMHPGRLLARTCLAPLSLNQSEAARLLGLSRRRLHELVHGQRAMSPDTAIRCARQFGIDAGFWLTQQAAWDSFHAWKRLCARDTTATPSPSH
ncbi:HigA family addiction module antitoxin [Hydrogenophaga sp. RWCD_12]|uniref:HigA family addiction module antitoxin n=1 Tax=Hydrogenophaga sp. RWCD_12 TaxID=3391190 RepID=UPI0039856445